MVYGSMVCRIRAKTTPREWLDVHERIKGKQRDVPLMVVSVVDMEMKKYLAILRLVVSLFTRRRIYLESAVNWVQ